MARTLTVRADEVQPGDLAHLLGHVLPVTRREKYSTRRTQIHWSRTPTMAAASTLLPHAEPVVVERP